MSVCALKGKHGAKIAVVSTQILAILMSVARIFRGCVHPGVDPGFLVRGEGRWLSEVRRTGAPREVE